MVKNSTLREWKLRHIRPLTWSP